MFIAILIVQLLDETSLTMICLLSHEIEVYRIKLSSIRYTQLQKLKYPFPLRVMGKNWLLYRMDDGLLSMDGWSNWKGHWAFILYYEHFPYYYVFAFYAFQWRSTV